MKKMKDFSERLWILQEDRTIAKFADDLGITRSTMGHYLRGERIPDIATFAKICEVCNVSADWLIGRSEAEIADIEIQAISNYTGLDDKAIKFLHRIKETPIIKFVNCFLRDTSLFKIASADYTKLANSHEKTNKLYGKKSIENDSIIGWKKMISMTAKTAQKYGFVDFSDTVPDKHKLILTIMDGTEWYYKKARMSLLRLCDDALEYLFAEQLEIDKSKMTAALETILEYEDFQDEDIEETEE